MRVYLLEILHAEEQLQSPKEFLRFYIFISVQRVHNKEKYQLPAIDPYQSQDLRKTQRL